MQDLFRLPELFSPGMLVRCVVSSLDVTESGKKSVKLSVNPKRVNKVLSAEALRPGMVCIWMPPGRGASRALSALGVVGATFFFLLSSYSFWSSGLLGT